MDNEDILSEPGADDRSQEAIGDDTITSLNHEQFQGLFYQHTALALARIYDVLLLIAAEAWDIDTVEDLREKHKNGEFWFPEASDD